MAGEPQPIGLAGRPPAAIVDPTGRGRRLAEGISAGQVRGVYQPIVCLAQGHRHGAEALARWRSPDGTDAPPAKFLPVAETTGLVVPMGYAIIEQVATAMGRSGPPARVTVNLSAAQLRDYELLPFVAGVVIRHRLEPRSLCFELTEAAARADLRTTAQVVMDLRGIGCLVGLDGVGVGTGAFTELHRLPLDFVKVDRALVQRMLIDDTALTAVRSIIQLAQQYEVATIAVGVEDAEQARWLAAMGCDYAQGNHFGTPQDFLVLPTPHLCDLL
jgi:EAL domain-containing protein (putative c-di-GMP-specific phosphodiesterase class I)